MRGRVITSRKDLWTGGPFKPLTEGLPRKGGRDSSGAISMRHRGGGHRRLYRQVDFVRGASAAPGVVVRIEYDPIRSARIALVRHEAPDGVEPARAADAFSYILAPQGLGPGSAVSSGPGSPIVPGSALPLHAIPIGMAIHNVELRPGAGGQLARAAGVSASIIKKGDDGYATVRLPSGELRLVPLECTATLGVLGNAQHKNIKHGKAGATRWRGRRPHVRGMAMNSVDHPHGGGRGKVKGRISQSPWGVPTKGYRTRNRGRRPHRTDWAIVTSRHKAKSR